MTSLKRVVPKHLRVVQRDLLTRRGGRNVIRSSTAVDYSVAYAQKYKSDLNTCPRLIDAEAIHGDEQRFWTAKRDFYRGGASRNFYPVWDRQAQVLITMTRHVARVPQEAAFRLFALGLKMMLLPRLTVQSELMLPSWMLLNAENALSEAKGDEKEKSNDKTNESDKAAKPDAEAPASDENKKA